MKDCGDCNICCKLPSVEEVGSRFSEWCPHCVPGREGCAIYQSRPKECREFSCLWRMTDLLDDRYRPDKCKIMLTPGPDDKPTAVIAWEVLPGACKQKRNQKLFRWMASKGLQVWLKPPDAPDVAYLLKEEPLVRQV